MRAPMDVSPSWPKNEEGNLFWIPDQYCFHIQEIIMDTLNEATKDQGCEPGNQPSSMEGNDPPAGASRAILQKPAVLCGDQSMRLSSG